MGKIIISISAAIALFASTPAVTAENLVGGYSQASVTNETVQAAAAAAITAQAKTLPAPKEGVATKLELVKILAAEQQVVAGMNYRLTLRVKLDGKEKTAEAVVWWQAWRQPDPYQLTTWKWTSE